MRDDDVRLSESERAAFEDLARRWTDVPDAASRWRRVVHRPVRRAVVSYLLLTVGVGALSSALLLTNAWAGAAAFVVLVVAVHRLTRRWSSVRLLLWWRRRQPPTPPTHMWEP